MPTSWKILVQRPALLISFLQGKTCTKLPILILGPSERGTRLFQLALYPSQFLVRVCFKFSSANCDAY
jgi:hypothetical protein